VTVLALPFGSGAGDGTIINDGLRPWLQAIRTSVAQVVPAKSINAWAIGAMNVENYSTMFLCKRSLR
jgi:hypothetical protein